MKWLRRRYGFLTNVLKSGRTEGSIVLRRATVVGVTSMVAKSGIVRSMIVGLMLAAFLIPASAHAIMVKKEIETNVPGEVHRGGRTYIPAHSGRNPLNHVQQQALQQAVANDSDSYLDKQLSLKSAGKLYYDLEDAKFSYVPMRKGGGLMVQAKLTARQYKGDKADPARRGRATGKSSALVFNYKVEGNKMVAAGEPTWQDVEASAAKKKK